MKLRLRIYESAPTNSMGNSSTIHGTGNIDTTERPFVARVKKRAKNSFRDKLAGRRVSESRQHVLNWNGRRFEITPSRNGKNRAILPQTPNRYIATAKKPVILGRSTPLIVNPEIRQTQNKVAEGYSLIGRALAAAVGAYVGNKIRKKLFVKSTQQPQQRSLPKTTPSRYNPTSGPWGNRVQEPSHVTGPKIKSANNNSSSSTPSANSQMSSSDFRALLKKNPALKVSGGRK